MLSYVLFVNYKINHFIHLTNKNHYSCPNHIIEHLLFYTILILIQQKVNNNIGDNTTILKCHLLRIE